jgi:hypothetical protein
MYLVLSAFTSSIFSLVATIKASAFSFTVCTLPPKISRASPQNFKYQRASPQNFKYERASPQSFKYQGHHHKILNIKGHHHKILNIKGITTKF